MLTSTKEVLEYQQMALIAQGEILGGSAFTNKLILKTWNLNKLREAERRGELENLRFSRTGEVYFEQDGDPADRKEKKPEGTEEKKEEASSPQEPPSTDAAPSIKQQPQNEG